MSDELLVVKKRVIISPLWIMPFAAAIIVVWMLVNGHLNNGSEITIEFDTSVGLVAGKTSLIYRGLEVGKVQNISISQERPDRVIVSARLKKGAEALAKIGSSFWIVRPTIGLNEISNLDTLLTGAYIAVKPPTLEVEKLDKLEVVTQFVGHFGAPKDDICIECKKIRFYSHNKENLKEGSGIYFRDFKVGSITSVDLNRELNRVEFLATIDSNFSFLLQLPIFLWKEGILDIDYSVSHFQINAAPIHSMLDGRIELGVLPKGNSNSSASLPLFKSEEEAKKSYWKQHGGKLVVLNSSVGVSVQKGSPIFYKKIPIGEIASYRMAKDGINVEIEAFIFPSFAKLLGRRSYFISSSNVHFDLERLNFKFPDTQLLMKGGLELKNADVDCSISKSYRLFESDQQADQFIKSLRPGLRIILKALKRKSITENSPILYRQVPVGDVEWYKLNPSGTHVLIGIFIQDAYKHLVTSKTKFWNVSGVQASMSISGMKVSTESIRSILDGGISFSTNEKDRGNKLSGGETFNLEEVRND